MLPVGAIAVALLLNGSQILLPAPAFVDQGRTWVPARAVLERLEERVRWLPAARALEVRLRTGRTAVFPLAEAPAPPGLAHDTARCARRVGNTIYLPLVALRELGLGAHWDAPHKQALLQAPLALPSPTLAAILADPPAWNCQPVTLSGEYLGWSPEPFCFATSAGPPVSSGDWVLHNEDGAIYCSPAPDAGGAAAAASLARLTSPLPAFTPYAALGQRLAVSGLVRLTRQARPYLSFSSVTRPEGLEGLTCRLILGREAYAPGARVSWTLQLANPQATRVAVGAISVVDVTLAGPEGVAYITKQSFPPKTKGSMGLAAGEELVIAASWVLPAEAPVGRWAIAARLSEQVGTYRRYFSVQPVAEERAQ